MTSMQSKLHSDTCSLLVCTKNWISLVLINCCDECTKFAPQMCWCIKTQLYLGWLPETPSFTGFFHPPPPPHGCGISKACPGRGVYRRAGSNVQLRGTARPATDTWQSWRPQSRLEENRPNPYVYLPMFKTLWKYVAEKKAKCRKYWNKPQGS